jgi:MFS family permease
VIGIAFGVGFAIGPAISGLLASYDPDTATHAQKVAAMSRPLFLAAALSGLSILATAVLLKNETPPPDTGADGGPLPAGRRLGVLEWRGYFAFFRRARLASLLLQFFLFSIAFSVFITGFALFAKQRFTWDGHPFRAREVGYVYAYAGFLGILIQGGLLRQLSKRYGDAPLVIAGFACSVVGYFLLGLVDTVGLLLVSVTITSFGHGFIRPALTARVTHLVERHELGVVLGLTQSLQSLAAVFAPPLGNLLIDHHQLFWWAIAAATVSALALAAALADRKEPAPEPDLTVP